MDVEIRADAAAAAGTDAGAITTAAPAPHLFRFPRTATHTMMPITRVIWTTITPRSMPVTAMTAAAMAEPASADLHWPPVGGLLTPLHPSATRLLRPAPSPRGGPSLAARRPSPVLACLNQKTRSYIYME